VPAATLADVADRAAQLAYSELQANTKDEAGRRRKAKKMIAVIGHFCGIDDFAGRTVLDLGSSTGFIASEFHRAGAFVVGVDIDVPGLTNAATTFPDEAGWACADGAFLPLADRSVDVVVFNHVYEHVLDPVAAVAEIRRVLRPDGVVFLGLSNRLAPIEPHVRLPFAAWMPPSWSDQYVRLFRRGDRYHERLQTRWSLLKLLRDFRLWEYTFTVIAEPERFAAAEMVSGRASGVLWRIAKVLTPFLPTYLWIGVLDDRSPSGPPTRVKVRQLPAR
jgi:SAM-dependent methyltransferase